MRLIDADKFGAVLNNIFNHLYESGRTDLAGALAAFTDMLKKQPTIDAVPVVRCKDCKHSFEKRWCAWHESEVRGNDFCSYGEQKGGEG